MPRVLPTGEPIDLLNVAFENPRALAAAKSVASHGKSKKGQVDTNGEQDRTDSMYDVPDRLTGRSSVQVLRRVHPDREWRFVEVNVPYKASWFSCVHANRHPP